MNDSPPRTSDAAGNANRKRRSSILKSQRPPRAPFSELEFSVATPTDTTKSRRVSFSRRTGVAEFVTHESTTTWKNFYEEHNRTLESSENELGPQNQRPSIGHLGKHIFEDQFQTVEIVDFTNDRQVETNMQFDQLDLEPSAGDKKLPFSRQHFEFSQVTETESKMFCNDFVVSGVGEVTEKIDIKFSSVQPVVDDLDEMQKDLERIYQQPNNAFCPGPRGPNASEYIEVDFNTTCMAIGHSESAEDMSITETVQSPKVNVSKGNKSIEKVSVEDKENIAINPYVMPKESENFAINENPDQVLVFDGKRLTIQTETKTDYKNEFSLLKSVPHTRKTIVLNVNDDLPNFVDNPKVSACLSNITNKTIFGDSLDISETIPEKPENAKKGHTILFDNDCNDISTTQALLTNINQNKNQQTIVFDSDVADISMTIALHANIVNDFVQKDQMTRYTGESEKRKTIVLDSDEAKFSTTQALRGHIIDNTVIKDNQESCYTEKRRTIMFDNGAADISMTQALPGHIVGNIVTKDEQLSNNTEKRKTIVFDSDAADISMTQALPGHIVRNIVTKDEQLSNNTEKRKTIVFDSDAADISMTQALPGHIVRNIVTKDEQLSNNTEKRKTIVLDSDSADISMTQALPGHIVRNIVTNDEQLSNNTEKRKTIVFDSDAADISLTQALPGHIVGNIVTKDEQLSNNTEKRKTIVFDSDAADISMTQALPGHIVRNIVTKDEQLSNNTEKRKTIVFDSDAADISMTQALPGHFVRNIVTKDEQLSNNTEKRKTIVFDSDAADIFMTQALPGHIVGNIALNDNPTINNTEKRKTIVFDGDTADISLTQTLPGHIVGNIALNDNPTTNNTEKRRTIVFDSDGADISMTQALPGNIVGNIALNDNPTAYNIEKRRTIVFDSDGADISMTQTLPGHIMDNLVQKDNLTTGNADKNNTLVFDSVTTDISMTQAVQGNVVENVIFKNSEETGIRKTVVFDGETNDVSITTALHSHIVESFVKDDQIAKYNDKRKILYENDMTDVSVTNTIQDHIIQNEVLKQHNLQNINTERTGIRKTLVFESEEADGTVTQAVKTEIKNHQLVTETNSEPTQKRKTIVFNSDAADISLTQALPGYAIENSVHKNNEVTIDSENQEKPTNFNNIATHISVNEANHSQIAENKLLTNQSIKYAHEISRCKSLVFDSDVAEISATQSFHAKITEDKVEEVNKKSTISEENNRNILTNQTRLNKTLQDLRRSVLNLDNDPKLCNVTLGTESIIKPKVCDASIALSGDSMTKENSMPKENCITISNLSNRVITEEMKSVNRTTLEDNHKVLTELPMLTENLLDESKYVDNKLHALCKMESKDVMSDYHLLKSNQDPENDNMDVSTTKPLSSSVILPEKADNDKKHNDLISQDLPMCEILESKTIKRRTIDASKLQNDITFAMSVLGNEIGFDTEENSKLLDISLNNRFKEKEEVVSDTKITGVTLDFGDLNDSLIKPVFGENSYLIHHSNTYQKDVLDDIKPQTTDPVKELDEVMPLENVPKELKAHISTDNIQAPSQEDLFHEPPDTPNNHKRLKSDINSGNDKNMVVELSHRFEVYEDCVLENFEPNCNDWPDVTTKLNLNTPSSNNLNPTLEYIEPHQDKQNQSNVTFSKTDLLRNTTTSVNVTLDTPCHVVSATVSPKLSKDYTKDQIVIATNSADIQKYTNEAIDDDVKLLQDDSAVTLVDISTDEDIFVPEDGLHETSNTKILSTENQAIGEVDIEINDAQKLTDDVSLLAEVDNIHKSSINITEKPSVFEHDVEIVDSQKPTDVSFVFESGKDFSKSAKKTETIPDINETNKACLNVSKTEGTKVGEDITKPTPAKETQKRANSKCARSPHEITPKPAAKTLRRSFTPENVERSPYKDKNKTDLSDMVKKQNQFEENRNECEERENLPTACTTEENVEAMSVDPTSSCKSVSSDFQSCSSKEHKNLSKAEELSQEVLKEASSQDLEQEDKGKSTADVVDSIELLPFMGGEDCQWECAEGCDWSFLLLRGALRLRVRVDATTVTDDTPVTEIDLEQTNKDMKSPIGKLCVRFASERMRQFGRACARAGELPKLLARCHSTATLALNWGRAMHDLYLSTAFTLNKDGRLSFNVLNVPLKSIYEISMDIALCTDGGAPWPRAQNVTVATLVQRAPKAGKVDVQRTTDNVPKDWGHAPRTVLRVYELLRNQSASIGLFDRLNEDRQRKQD